MPGPGLDGTVWALTVWDDGRGPALYAAGEFATAGGQFVGGIARWDGVSWSPLTGSAGTGVDGIPSVLAVFDDGSGPALYVGGAFDSAGGLPAKSIARWDGDDWSALRGSQGEGLETYSDKSLGWAEDFAAFDDGSGPALYVAGHFDTAGGIVAPGLARWNGREWSYVAGGDVLAPGGRILALSTWESSLYLGGDFSSFDGVFVNQVARWGGDGVAALDGPSGVGVDGGLVSDLSGVAHGAAAGLYAAGWFSHAGGIPAHGIARWDGSRWWPLAGGTATGEGLADASGSGGVGMVLELFGEAGAPSLVVGGAFSRAGGVTAHNVARWDGSSWSALAGPEGEGVEGEVFALAGFADPTGPALYVGGDVTTAGGVVSPYLARWWCDEPPNEPPAGPWLESEEVPGFAVKARFGGAGGPLVGRRVPACLDETLCVAGALPERAELFVRVVGPKPNGKLWPTIVKFSTSRVEVWIEQKATGTIRYYELPAVAPGVEFLELDGLADKLGFEPADDAEALSELRAGGPQDEPAAPPLAPPLPLTARVTSPDPPAGPWLASPEVPGFRTKVRIRAGDTSLAGAEAPSCVDETLCVSGALPDRAELFVRIVGPKPNGRLWPTLVKLSTSRVEVWIEQTATGDVRYYDLPAVAPGARLLELDGLADKLGFEP